MTNALIPDPANYRATLEALGLASPTPSPSPLAQMMAEMARRPRSRYEWELRFTSWQRPASETVTSRPTSTQSKKFTSH